MTAPEYPCAAHCPGNRKDWQHCNNFRYCYLWKDWFCAQFALFNAYAQKHGILPTTEVTEDAAQ